ncbi:MAG: putative PEP-binding protein [Xenococcaceae cyanobacterium]
MKEIYWLDRITNSQRHLVGDRAVRLSNLGQKGYPILPGVAIGASVLREFMGLLRDSNSWLTDYPTSLHVDVDDYKALQIVARQSRQAIVDTCFPSEWLADLYTELIKLNCSASILHPSVAIAHADSEDYASLLRSQVCWLNTESLATAIKQVWAELFSAKSLFYIRKARLDLEQIQLAVLVQPLDDAIASGTAKIDREILEINSTWGLEDSLILGQVQPDFYQIQLATKEVSARQLGIKTKAYRLQAHSLDGDCLETYIPNEREQQSYSLDENYLSQSIEILTKNPEKLDDSTSLAWSFLKSNLKNSEAKFYITQSFSEKNNYSHSNRDRLKQKIPEKVTRSNQKAYPSNKFLMPEDTHPLLNGLGASPGVAIAPAIILASSDWDVQHIPAGQILVMKNFDLGWLPLIKKAAGLIVEGGGLNSHAAILARETNIPAVVAAKNATMAIAPEELILVNGHTGAVYRIEGSTDVEVHRSRNDRASDNHPLPITHYPIATKLMVNISQPSSIGKAATLPVDGLGLLRSELMMLDFISSQPLEEWLSESRKPQLLENWTNSIADNAAAFAPRPIFYRSLDLYAVTWRDCAIGSSINSLLGWRGTYNYSLDSSLFELELEALLTVQKQGYDNLKLILPFVRSVDEFSYCRRLIDKVGLSQNPSFQVWIMAEIPSVIFLLSEYVKAGVQGIAIGTNDLTQLLLGVDREITYPNASFNPMHPAMLAALKQLIQTAKLEGIPCSICGQATVEHPELIDRLIEWGITTISTELEAIESTYRAIARAEQRLLLELARSKISGI